MRKVLLWIALLLCLHASSAFASMLDQPVQVAVMDFGTHKGAATADINLENAEKTAGEYVTQRLVNCGKFFVVDKDMVMQAIQEHHLNTVGLIDPDTAKKLGELLNAKYIVYGNVVDVTLSDTGTRIAYTDNGVTVATVKSHIIARIMNVDTGDIIMAAKGEGKSKSSYVKVGAVPVGMLQIGTHTVTQDSVHNAIQKAAYAAVDLLVKRLEAMP